MTALRKAALCVVMLSIGGWAGTPVVFIGLSNQGAPSIENNLTRLMDEQFAAASDVLLVANDEAQRLRARIDQFTYPVMSASLTTALNRFAPDSALVVWGMIRECSIKPARRHFFRAQLQAALIIELTVIHRVSGTYAYVGDAKALLTRDKGFVFWFGRIEDAVVVSAPERAALLEQLQIEGARSAVAVLQALLLHDRSKDRAKKLPPGVSRKEVTVEPAAAPESAGPEDPTPAGTGEDAEETPEEGEAAE